MQQYSQHHIPVTSLSDVSARLAFPTEGASRMDVAEIVFLVTDATTHLVIILTLKPFIDLNIIHY
jgi:hypothetical protein